MSVLLQIAQAATTPDHSDPDYAAAAAAGAAALSAIASGISFLGATRDPADQQAKLMKKAADEGKELAAPDAAKKVKDRQESAAKAFGGTWILAVLASVAAAILAFMN